MKNPDNVRRGKRANRKGKTGEREWANHCKDELGFPDSRRGARDTGNQAAIDVVGIPGCHAEVKRCEKLSIYTAMKQAVSDAAVKSPGCIPYVAHRRNYQNWLVIVESPNLIEFCKRVLAAHVKDQIP